MSELNDLLERVGLTQYTQAFASQNLDREGLSCLSDYALNEMGILREHIYLLRQAMSDVSTRGETAAKSRTASAERRQISILFCDLVGSTELSLRMDPEDLRDVIEKYRQTCIQPIHYFGGFIQRFVGDGILALFGYPNAHEDDAERAVRSGLGIVEAMHHSTSAGATAVELKVRIGIATGAVVVGDILEDRLAEKSAVVGDAPNLAARLQTLAEPNTVVIDSETRQLAAEHFEYRGLGSINIKGIEQPIQAYLAVGERSGNRFEARGVTPAPLVGRQREINILRDLWHRAQTGAGQVALLTGSAGIGKSRLMVALSQNALAEAGSAGLEDDPFQIGLQCTQFQINAALNPFIRHLERLAAIQRTDSNDSKMAKLDKALDQAELARETRHILADLLAIDVGGLRTPLSMAPRERRYRTLDAFEAWYAALSARRPLLIIVEDIQWMDPSSQELFRHLVERARHARMLIIASLRTSGDGAPDASSFPGQNVPWIGQPHVNICALAELGDAEARQLLLATSKGHDLAPGTIETILQRSEGNPLYLEELTKALIALKGCDRRPTNGSEPSSMLVPATINGLLLARLDQVGYAREVAQQAAVIGREFSLELLKAISTLPKDHLGSAIDALNKAELIQPVRSTFGMRYAFKHTLIQDSAYHSLLKRTRRLLHHKIAEQLEQDRHPDASVTDDVIAEHYARACDHRKAAEKFKRAADAASERSAQVEAANLLQKALGCIDGLDNRREHQLLELEITLQLASALGSVRGYAATETEEQFSRAQSLCVSLDDKTRRFNANFGLFISGLVKGDLVGANELAQELYKHAKENQKASFVDACLANGMIQMQMGHFAKARALLEKAVRLSAPEIDAPHLQTHALNPGIYSRSYLAHVLSFLGYSDDALALVEDNLALARKRAADPSHIYTYVSALTFAGRVHLLLRDASAVNEVSQELVRVSRQHHYDYFEAIGRIQQGWAIADMGSVRLGIQQMHDGLAALERTGTGLGVPGACVQLSELYARLGEKANALTALNKAVGRDGRGSHIWDAEIARVRGEIELLPPAGDPVIAEDCFSQALDIAQSQQAHVLEQRAAVSYARFLRDRHRSAEAFCIIDKAARSFCEKRETKDIANVRLLLSELSRTLS